MKQGRPTRLEQVKMKKTIRPYYERYYTASYTSIKTRIDIKTVCKYFNEWTEQIRKIEERDFFIRQKLEKERIILTYDNLIFEEYISLDEINDEIKKYKKQAKVPRYLFSVKNEILRNISNLTEKKGSFLMQPPIEETIEKKIEEIMKKDVKS